MLGDLVEPEAFLPGAVEIVVARVACLYRRLNEYRPETVRAAQVHHIERATYAVEIIGSALVVLRPFEVGEHIAPAPAWVALCGPVVVVRAMAPRIDHGIDRARSAQHLAAGLVPAPPVQAGLRHGLESPVGLPALRHQRETGGAVDQHAAVGGAGLVELRDQPEERALEPMDELPVTLPEFVSDELIGPAPALRVAPSRRPALR